jgi:hypothetical protein
MTESITIYFASAKLILVIHLKMQLGPTCEVKSYFLTTPRYLIIIIYLHNYSKTWLIQNSRDQKQDF